MSELNHLARLKLQLAAGAMRSFLRGSRLRVAVVTAAAAIFWLLMFGMFLDAFIFLSKFEGINEIVTDYLFALFFVVLLVMMTISNAIISYTSFYRNEETAFLLSMPLRAESIFVYKGVESIVFSAWGTATLVVPLILAYGLTAHAPWYFYVLSFLLAAVFTGIPLELGALAALVIPMVLPRRRKTTLVLVALVAAALLAAWGLPMLRRGPSRLFTEAGIRQITRRIAFCQHWALPSYWVSDGIIGSARREAGHAVLLLLRLLANVLFLGMVSCRLGNLLYLRAWASAHVGGQSRSRRPGSRLDRAFETVLSPLPSKLRLLVLKDIKTFRRDPAQWSQVVVFFGLLGLYILSLPRMKIYMVQAYWRSLVSLLNLGAASLTLSTLTSRFVFPQLSLEGRRIWIVGLVPMERSALLWGKFVFAAAGSLIISGGLITLSDLMLELPAWTVLVHMVVVLCVCCGLNGLAVGLGAVYPDMRSDDPSKIVSSFGGTLNLVCSICFIMACVVPVAIPLHLHTTQALAGRPFALALGTALAIDIALGALTCLIPMLAGQRSFRRMEF